MERRYTLTNHDSSNNFFDPSPDEIVINYWRDRARDTNDARLKLLREYDELTLKLSIAYGPGWRSKLARKANKENDKAEREAMAEESYGERL